MFILPAAKTRSRFSGKMFHVEHRNRAERRQSAGAEVEGCPFTVPEAGPSGMDHGPAALDALFCLPGRSKDQPNGSDIVICFRAKPGHP